MYVIKNTLETKQYSLKFLIIQVKSVIKDNTKPQFRLPSTCNSILYGIPIANVVTQADNRNSKVNHGQLINELYTTTSYVIMRR